MTTPTASRGGDRVTVDPHDLRGLLGAWATHSHMLSDALASRITNLVTNGHIPTGTQLPPTRNLADAISVSRSVVRDAYDLLHLAGTITRDRYVTPTHPDA